MSRRWTGRRGTEQLRSGVLWKILLEEEMDMGGGHMNMHLGEPCED
jgi:hypothetical protein